MFAPTGESLGLAMEVSGRGRRGRVRRRLQQSARFCSVGQQAFPEALSQMRLWRPSPPSWAAPCPLYATRCQMPLHKRHDLRHACATLLLTKGVHPKVVSEMLGHSSMAITLNVYSHVIPGLGDAAASAMEFALKD